MIELIDRFPNGQELYNTNAVFNRLVNCIHQGMNLYQAISIFAEQNEDLHNLVKELIEKMPIQPIIVTEEE